VSQVNRVAQENKTINPGNAQGITTCPNPVSGNSENDKCFAFGRAPYLDYSVICPK
jgi:hypothetical protein